MNTKHKFTLLFFLLSGLFILPLSAQKKDRFNYQKTWKQIEKYQKKGLTRSALEEVEAIYVQAKKEGVEDQQMKALIHRIALQAHVEEKADTITIALLQAEIAEAKLPVKQLMQSLLADVYWNYYRENRWRIMNRTALSEGAQDFQTWDAQQFHQEISDLYMASLSPAKSLQKIAVRDFEAILITAKESDVFRPTLYDFLGHRALDYYMNSEAWLTEPANPFEMKAAELLVSANQFAKLKLDKRDSLSRKLQVLTIFQKLINLHNEQGRASQALVDVDLKRLKYVREHAIGKETDSLYSKALLQLAYLYRQHPISSEVQYEIAKLYNQRAQKYKPLESDAYQWDRKKALNICEEVIEKYPEARGAQMCRQLKAGIEAHSLSLQVEEVNLPKQPFRARLSYKNLDAVYFRIIPDDPSFHQLRERKQMAKRLTKALVLQTWSVKLNNEGDYQQHATEIKVPALGVGEYLILASDDIDFGVNEHAIAYAPFKVTSLSYVYRTENQQLKGYVMHRDTGEPLEDVSLKQLSWDYKSKSYIHTGETRKTDEEGAFYFTSTADYKRYVIEMRLKGQSYRTETIYGYGYRHDRKQEYTRVHFFTDRKIYRPGQTVYFKAIVLSQKGKSHQIIANYDLGVEFRDVNAEKIGSLELKTNEFGTLHGSFIAPSGGLLGNMQLYTEHGHTNIRVEEYKRPKFEVVINPIEGKYALGDQVSVSGHAKAYSGANIDAAKVRYRVVREARFPYWFRWWIPSPQSPAKEIASGETTTDENGVFKFDFLAISDKDISQDSKPIFSYRITVDVIDITGETHSGSSFVRAGYVGLDLSIHLAEKIDASKPDSLTITSKNLNGQYQVAKGTLTISALDAPDHLFRSRRWEQVDRQVLSEKDYREAFPLDVYARENDHKSWEVSEVITSQTFDTDQAKKIALTSLKDAEEGWYKFELKTADGEVELVKYVQVYNAKSKRLKHSQLLQVIPNKITAEPGEEVNFLLASSERKLWVLYEVEKDGKILQKEWIQLKKNKKEIKLPITEAYRGNVVVSFSLIRYNEYHNEKYTIQVPWSNKQLQLEWMSFRSELLPGQEEQWKLKIKGPKGEKVAAEFVAALYDASLDAFSSNSFGLNIYPTYHSQLAWNAYDGFGTDNSHLLAEKWNPRVYGPTARSYDQLNWFGFGGGFYGIPRRGALTFGLGSRRQNTALEEMVAAPAMKAESKDTFPAPSPEKEADVDGISDLYDQQVEETKAEDLSAVPIRTNLNETAFFFPQMETNEAGEIVLNFSIPEALTRWKFLGLAHTKNLEIGTLGGETETKKDLMVVPNVPRFFREGDSMIFTAKVSNLSEKELSGVAELILLDAFNMTSVADKFGLADVQQTFVVPAGQSSLLSWQIQVPEDVSVVATQVIAKAGDFSDGEENIVPVLKNRLMLTESLPLAIRGNQSKEFTFKKLVENKSTTLSHQKLTLEFSSNPAWYAVQSLPYLMEYPHQCSEQIYSRFYANALATHIANSSPKTRQVFEQWRTQTPDATLAKQSLLANLEKNQELKGVLLEETPWVLNARDEKERKRRVGMLFDLNRMSSELDKARRQLQERQNNDGSFSWFPGMPSSRYITQLLITGLGHLQKLGVGIATTNPEVSSMVSASLPYLDKAISEDFQKLKYYKMDLKEDHLGSTQIQYLYMRSFFVEQELAEGTQAAFDYYFRQAKRYWLKKSPYMQGMLALALARYQEEATAKEIIASLKENALFSEELGMYWKQASGYFWDQAPIERQALMIEAFEEITGDRVAVEEMKIWLLKNKQTNDWESTRATVAACNALLSSGTDWLESEQLVDISLGGIEIDPNKLADAGLKAGTGYFKTAWLKDEIQEEMGNITLSKKDEGIAWGALYWQYFEQMDKVTYAATPLSLQKQLFIETNTESGPLLTPITSETIIKAGDKVKVRIELRVDRAMEYVHLKDMRAAAFEPINVLSQYKRQGGLGYYESTKDASTHFFFEYLPKGTHVFEYPLRATQQGNFSNGITTIQCMYAPEFRSHSEGIRVKVGAQ